MAISEIDERVVTLADKLIAKAEEKAMKEHARAIADKELARRMKFVHVNY